MLTIQWVDDEANRKTGFWIHKIVGDAGWSFPTHTHHGFCELVCATSGTFRHVINGRQTEQTAGDLVLIRETDCHELAGKHFVYVNVMFPAHWLTRLSQFMDIPETADSLLAAKEPPRARVPKTEIAHFSRTLDVLRTNSNSHNGRHLFAQFLLTAVAKHLNPVSEPDIMAGLPGWLHETLVWLRQNRSPATSVQDLVKHSCRCHEHFTRQFTHYLGSTPSAYLAGLKIEHAAEMLITTNHKLFQVCQEAGFDNESYFFRLFRKLKRMSPMEYRRAYAPRSIQR